MTRKVAVLDFTADERDGCLRIDVTGQYESGAFSQLVDLVAQQSERHQCDRVLLDLRALQGSIPDMDRFAAGVYASQVWKTSLRAAIILRREEIDRFFANTAVNRGVQTLVVATLVEAKSWLGVS